MHGLPDAHRRALGSCYLRPVGSLFDEEAASVGPFVASLVSQWVGNSDRQEARVAQARPRRSGRVGSDSLAARLLLPLGRGVWWTVRRRCAGRQAMVTSQSGPPAWSTASPFASCSQVSSSMWRNSRPTLRSGSSVAVARCPSCYCWTRRASSTTHLPGPARPRQGKRR